MRKFAVSAAAVALLLAAGAARADDFQPKAQGHWLVNGRISDVAPDTSDAITTAAGAATGLHVDVSDSVMPTLGFTYFLTDNLAVEAILGTTEHTVSAKGGTTNVKVHKTWVLPPVVALQYHFLPKARFSPYIGAGVNYMLFYGGKNENGFTVKLKDGFGGALQAGADYAISGPWSANFDVKKVFFSTDASINSGALKSKVGLDPWVISVGIGRKF
jgi:outer membrane protein